MLLSSCNNSYHNLSLVLSNTIDNKQLSWHHILILSVILALESINSSNLTDYQRNHVLKFHLMFKRCYRVKELLIKCLQVVLQNVANKEAGISQVANINQLRWLYIPSNGYSDRHLLIFRVELSILMGEKPFT